ncbi:PREDICTED: pentatricopeptide repeat-containing protein At2g33760 [Tarenaya hassleriana]|uniref:pentatricopeptide repeat-containing protein At2g33760 n=1 Tax=Tarenaya hassleriana TaxID=28532 RepID=UPI00053C1A9D|nr:PREDICTED: pentatricopeptide repeat-containing protein At2g33760 [Tarenaya hassleriana]
METKHVSSNSAAYESIVRAGPRVRQLQQAHAHLIVTGYGRIRSLLTKLVTLACASRSIAYTRLLFLSIPFPDAFLFNSIIKSTSKFHFSLDCVWYYRRMLSANVPPCNYTFTSVIKSCADLAALQIGRGIHGDALVSGFGMDPYVQAALVAFYSKCGEMKFARQVFDRMPEKTVVAWNSLISGFEQNGLAKEAIGVFHLMRDSGFEPDSATFVSVLSACAQTGTISLGSWVHQYIVSKGFDVNVVLGTALINLYSRCGDVGKARDIFDGMKERNVIAWTAMISAYGTHGYGNQAVELFREMRNYGPMPNNVTFVAILSACAHVGLVEEGQSVYESISRDYGFIPSVEHDVCMVDMLGRAGFLDEAYRFIMKLDGKGTEAAPAVLTAMLGACKMHKNFDLGVQIAKRLIELEPENPGHYVMLSNIYALSGKTDEVEGVRNAMIGKSLRKKVGHSVIEVEREAYLFIMGDKSHPETREIYQYLDTLMSRCRDIGYVPVDEAVMHQVEEEEREFALRYHSEKLAVAFGLLKTRNGAIKVVKNLRICEDCHSAFKYASVVADREIIVRDKLRFHHFKAGSCSCLDYW